MLSTLSSLTKQMLFLITCLYLSIADWGLCPCMSCGTLHMVGLTRKAGLGGHRQCLSRIWACISIQAHTSISQRIQPQPGFNDCFKAKRNGICYKVDWRGRIFMIPRYHPALEWFMSAFAKCSNQETVSQTLRDDVLGKF